MDLFKKCVEYDLPKKFQKAGLYHYFKIIKNAENGTAIIGGEKKIMAGSNNYLGLTHHPKVREAAIKTLQEYGTGCSGSRFLNGTIDLHVELEERLAQFTKKEAALVFSTGFQTNLGTISCLVGKGDFIFSDKENHGSIIEGTRLSEGKTIIFKHNDMKDLERLLKKHPLTSGKLIVVDGVYSMTGDIAKLDEIVKLAKKYKARVMVDDAHGVGVIGKNGRGTADHFNITEDVDLIMGTFSKSFASLGGFIAGSEDVIYYIKHHARSFILSASMPPASVATVLAVLDIIENNNEHIERLWENTKKMKQGLDAMGYNTHPSQTPIIPINIGDDLQTLRFAKAVYDEGVFANPVLPPGISAGQSLIRTSYMATHSNKELDFILNAFEKVGKLCHMI